MGDNGPGVGDALDGAPPEAGAVQAEGRGQDAGPHVVLAAQSNCNVENRLSLLCIEGSSCATDLSQFVCQLQICRAETSAAQVRRSRIEAIQTASGL